MRKCASAALRWAVSHLTALLSAAVTPVSVKPYPSDLSVTQCLMSWYSPANHASLTVINLCLRHSRSVLVSNHQGLFQAAAWCVGAAAGFPVEV